MNTTVHGAGGFRNRRVVESVASRRVESTGGSSSREQELFVSSANQRTVSPQQPYFYRRQFPDVKAPKTRGNSYMAAAPNTTLYNPRHRRFRVSSKATSKDPQPPVNSITPRVPARFSPTSHMRTRTQHMRTRPMEQSFDYTTQLNTSVR